MATLPFDPPDDGIRDRDWARRMFADLSGQRKEVVAFAYFDPEWRYLGMRHRAPEGAQAAVVPIREVARDVLSLDARLVLMAHNHPSGDHRPSADDLAVTARLSRTLNAIGVRLVDHLILGRDGCTSLRNEGLL